MRAPEGAIAAHFRDSPHTLDDIEFVLLEGLSKTVPGPLLHPLRTRLESRWILKLAASLNRRRHLRVSFSGGVAAQLDRLGDE